MYNPVSSYRIQFNGSFTLNDLEQHIDYLNKLGVGSIYASPVFSATPGSNHGYDITNPLTVNPEIGSFADLQRLSGLLRESGTGWIQDFVPNHMAYHSGNPWIWDLLEKGPASQYTGMFDIEPEVAEGSERLMLPFLGSTAHNAIYNLELQVSFRQGSLALKYYDNLFPASFESFRSVFSDKIEEAPDCFRLIWNRYGLAEREADSRFLNGKWEIVKEEISSFCETDPGMQAFTGKILQRLNSNHAMISNFVRQQHYEPCHWKETSRRINFRRFFTVNGLICLRAERKEVVEQHHRFLKELIESGYIDGLRIDHIDGLNDPAGYLRRLRSFTGDNMYIVVEKILEKGEKIPGNWVVEGTTGYEFLSVVNNLMMPGKGYKKLKKFYNGFTGETDQPGWLIYNSKKLILESHMKGEKDNLYKLFEKLLVYADEKGIASLPDKKGLKHQEMKKAISEFMLAFPVYRLYPDEYPISGRTREMVMEIFDAAIKNNPGLRNGLRLLKDLVTTTRGDNSYNNLLGDFLGRMMQYTGPLTAKGVEDTSMYRYSCFIAGNEVGDHLDDRGMNKDEFHEAMLTRQQDTPLSMNCTSTHDTKRGEDVRARLNALGAMTGEWTTLVKRWKKVNSSLKREIPSIPEKNDDSNRIAMMNPGFGKIEIAREKNDTSSESSKNNPGAPGLDEQSRTKSGKAEHDPEGSSGSCKVRIAPSAGEEYFIYQTIAGSCPFNGETGSEYAGRIKEYMVKTLREAKQNSSWEEPDKEYEEAVCNFAEALLSKNSRFLKTFIPFHRDLAAAGIVNSLAQLAVKCFAPGIPDIYRGTEVWDLSLVDPDNRRPVNFRQFEENLANTVRRWNEDKQATTAELMAEAGDGRIKQLLTYIFLNLRQSSPDLFLSGDYVPLETGGKHSDHILAFARRHKEQWLLCIVPLHAGTLLTGKGRYRFRSSDWKSTYVTLPEGAPVKWQNVINGKETEAKESKTDVLLGQLEVSELFGDTPAAILSGRTVSTIRKAGVLLHISSLPGKYGTGDFGSEAFRFVDFLSRSSQTYWQTLPLSPITASHAWSPYSSPSAFALNTLFIDPKQLYYEGLINESELDNASFRNSSRAGYKKADEFRAALLEKAWEKVRKNTGSPLYERFENFCANEAYWLDDYSLFMACREKHRGSGWWRWPRLLRDRDEKTVKTAGYDLAGSIMQEKFNQFVAWHQWKKLKGYAGEKDIRILGDIPFYVSYDSADVWANRQLFNLRESGKMKTIAGVPPDYFDKNGQFWNMPVYDWQRLKETGYEWWLKRLAKNLELFDLLRLDHFRAFSAYWEVPAGSKTAAGGKWTKGPGDDIFKVLQERFPEMPFVAEDLGDIDDDVYKLRDRYGLPGMQVIQFSFGRDMATNIHTPHNYNVNSLAYTGTHDNNTLRGWYERELDKEGKRRLWEYAGKKIRSSQVHAELIRMAHSSAAATVIVPIQDYLGLGRGARMNTPSTGRGNWMWKLKHPAPYDDLAPVINRMTSGYNRM